MNSKLSKPLSLHKSTKKNGRLLDEFTMENNLVIGNLSFCKPRKKRWTYRSPTGNLSQIDFILYRQRWRNSVHNLQAFSISHPVGSDHRIVSASVKLSLRAPKNTKPRKLNWQALSGNQQLASVIDESVCVQYDSLPVEEKIYTTFVKIANNIGPNFFPKEQNKQVLQ